MTQKEEEREINSLSDFMKLFTSDISKDKRFYYRGETNKDNKLVPKILRDKILPDLKETYELQDRATSNEVVNILETQLLERYRRYAMQHHNVGDNYSLHGSLPSADEWICIAQHHGLPTLLLDWSINPLVALYFAVKRDGNIEKEGHVWCMSLKKKEEREHKTVYVGEQNNEGGRISSRNSYENKIVVPWAFHRRIEAQTSRFVYCGALLDESTSLNKQPIKTSAWESINRAVIPIDSKEHIRKQLEKMYLHEGTMFPSLDGYASYLSGGGL